jgi:hypothetical protein
MGIYSRRFFGAAVAVMTFSGLAGILIQNPAAGDAASFSSTAVASAAIQTPAAISNADNMPRTTAAAGPQVQPLAALKNQMTAVTPLHASQPRSHPLTPVGGPLPHALTTHTLTNGPLNLSSNWSGLFEEGSGATFTGVEADWTVPAVPSSAVDEASGTWLGIDGVGSSSLIQTGTAQNTGPDYGGTQYYAWIELLPGAPDVIGTGSVAAPVSPGDEMSASITETSLNDWTISLDDNTQSWTFSQPFAYSTPGSTAEWIEEAPTVGSSVATLPDYGSTSFTNLGIAGSGLSSAATYAVYMTTPTGAIISYPANINTSAGSFSLFYGSPSPQVTSVSPNQGGTSGGTSVTIGGNFITGVFAVAFGGVSVPFSADVADGTVTASAPAHQAGTVNITVTTPGGISSLSGGDVFTYVAPPPPPPAPSHGYWLVGTDGGIFSFGSAQFYGSTGNLKLQRPVVGIVPTSNDGGYWLDATDGGVFSFGDTQFFGSIPCLGLHPAGSGLPNSLAAPIVGMVPSIDDGGYFMVASDGGVFAFGDAHFAGSCPGIGGCSGAAVAVMPDASGNGYWLVTASGTVYTFGDAGYYGAPGNTGSPVTSAVRTPDGGGYWILTANGTVYNYGDAVNFGDAGGAFGGLNPATAIFTTSDGGGYWIASANGAVDPFGDAPNDGDMLGTNLNGSIIAATGF